MPKSVWIKKNGNESEIYDDSDERAVKAEYLAILATDHKQSTTARVFVSSDTLPAEYNLRNRTRR